MKEMSKLALNIFMIIFVLILSIPIVYPQQDAMIDIISAITKPEDITSPMGKWEKFLGAMEIIGLHVGFWGLALLYFGLFTLVIWLPLKIYPIISKHKKILGKFIHLKYKP